MFVLTPPVGAITVASDDARYGSFYVPAFEIRIHGKSLPRDVVRDVIQVTYSDNVNEIDHIEFTINNWDAEACDFKYTGIEGRVGAGDVRAKYLGLFDPGVELEVWMGYAGKPQLMMTGQITTLEPNFPQGGAPSLAIRALNILHQLRRKQYTDFWPPDGVAEVRDSDIAKDIAKKKGEKDKKGKATNRFPLPIRINDTARTNEPPEHYVMQKNEYDIVFLLTRARRHGYVVLIEEFGEKGKEEKRLYFGPSEGDKPGQRNVTYILEWGKSLIQFKPTLTTANQIGSVTVRGWNRRTKKPIEGSAKRSDIGLNSDLGEIEKSFNEREEIVTDKPVYNEAQAKALAKDILRNQIKDMVKGSGATIGLPDLRAGRKVFIAGLGSRFSGTYYVTDSTHTINDSGYQTTFNARREVEGAGTIA